MNTSSKKKNNPTSPIKGKLKEDKVKIDWISDSSREGMFNIEEYMFDYNNDDDIESGLKKEEHSGKKDVLSGLDSAIKILNKGGGFEKSQNELKRNLGFYEVLFEKSLETQIDFENEQKLKTSLSALNIGGVQRLMVLFLSNSFDRNCKVSAVKNVFCSLLRNNFWDFSKEKFFYKKTEIKELYEKSLTKEDGKATSKKKSNALKTIKTYKENCAPLSSLVNIYTDLLNNGGYQIEELLDTRERLLMIEHVDGIREYFYEDLNSINSHSAYDFEELLNNIKTYGWDMLKEKKGLGKEFSNSCYSNCLIPNDFMLDFLNLSGLSDVLRFDGNNFVDQNEIPGFISKWAEIVISNSFSDINVDLFKKKYKELVKLTEAKMDFSDNCGSEKSLPIDVILHENEKNIEDWLSENSNSYFLLKCLGWNTPIFEYSKIISNSLKMAISEEKKIKLKQASNEGEGLSISTSGLLNLISFGSVIGLERQMIPEETTLVANLLRLNCKEQEQDVLFNTLDELFNAKIITGSVFPVYEKNPFKLLALNHGGSFDLEKGFEWFLRHGWELSEERIRSKSLKVHKSGKMKGSTNDEVTSGDGASVSGKLLLEILSILPSCLNQESKWVNYSKVIDVLIKEEPNCIKVNLNGNGVLAKLNSAIGRCDRGLDSEEGVVFGKMLDLFDLFLEKGVPLESITKKVEPLSVIESEKLAKRVAARQEKDEIIRRVEQEKAKDAIELLSKIKSGELLLKNKKGETVDLATFLRNVVQENDFSKVQQESSDLSSKADRGLKLKRL